MPKKQIRNSFYFYMLDFKEKQRRLGINYGNMADVADAAGPAWKLEPPAVRAKFESEAKAEKQKGNRPEKKYTSQGVPLSVVANAQRQQQESEEFEKQDIQNMVLKKKLGTDILDEDFYIIDVNSYCKVGERFLIGEVALLRFNLRDGIRDYYHQMLDPGSTPVGFASDVKLGAQEFGLPMPGDGPLTSSAQLLALIIDYLRRCRPDVALPPVYTCTEKLPQAKYFIQELCQRAGEDEEIFRVYHLDLLFHWLVNAVSEPGQQFPRESMAQSLLKKDAFKYTPGLGCNHHEEGELATECAMARTKRWAFTILDMTCGRAAITAVPGRHVPGEFDVEGIISYRESHAYAPPPGNAWGTNDANSTAANSTSTDNPAKSRRVHKPLRVPKDNYAQKMREKPEPPRLNDADFPHIRGKGRGAGLEPSDFSNLRM